MNEALEVKTVQASAADRISGEAENLANLVDYWYRQAEKFKSRFYEANQEVRELKEKLRRRAPDEGVGVCDICGGGLVLIRGKHPRDDKREVCPTCLKEKSEMIVEMFSPKPPGDEGVGERP